MGLRGRAHSGSGSHVTGNDVGAGERVGMVADPTAPSTPSSTPDPASGIDPPSQSGALGVVIDMKRATGASSVAIAVARAVSLVK